MRIAYSDAGVKTNSGDGMIFSSKVSKVVEQTQGAAGSCAAC